MLLKKEINVTAIVVGYVSAFVFDLFILLLICIVVVGRDNDTSKNFSAALENLRSAKYYFIFELTASLTLLSLGGYVAGRISKSDKTLHGGIVGGLSLIIGHWISQLLPQVHTVAEPLWNTVSGYLLAIPAAAMGGHLATNERFNSVCWRPIAIILEIPVVGEILKFYGKYFSIWGRVNRWEYFFLCLFVEVFRSIREHLAGHSGVILIVTVCTLVGWWLEIASTVKRVRDIKAPTVLAFLFLVLSFTPTRVIPSFRVAQIIAYVTFQLLLLFWPGVERQQALETRHGIE